MEDNFITYRNKFRGKIETASATYEPDIAVRDWVAVREQMPTPAVMQYDPKSGILCVKKPDIGTIYQGRIRLPKDIQMDVLMSKYLKITDKLGYKFSEGSFFGKAESSNVLVGLNPFAVRDNKASFGYSIGGMQSGIDNLQDFLDNLMINTIYQQEFNRNTTKLNVGNKPIKVRGPNRNGDYELTSGKSSIIYSPQGDWSSLGRAWRSHGAQSTIIDGSVSRGEVYVRSSFGDRGYQIWKLDINFGNTDPDKSYNATMVRSTIK